MQQHARATEKWLLRGFLEWPSYSRRAASTSRLSGACECAARRRERRKRHDDDEGDNRAPTQRGRDFFFFSFLLLKEKWKSSGALDERGWSFDVIGAKDGSRWKIVASGRSFAWQWLRWRVGLHIGQRDRD